MNESIPTVNTGLRGVTVASTRISMVDGAAGKLIYRGYLVKDLAEKTTFEEVIYLLLFEKLPNEEEVTSFRRDSANVRAVPGDVLTALQCLPKKALPMDVLQAGVAMLAGYDPDSKTASREAYGKTAVKLVAQLTTLLAAWARIRKGEEPITPNPDLGHAANFLYMLTGEIPDDDQVRFMDACLVLHADHTFNASTFTARQIASAQAHMYSAVVGAIGSLSGDLHGGANVRVMRMLQEIGSIDNVAGYVENILKEGKVIFGLGHAVYKVDDPRALILAPMSKTMCDRTGQSKWYEISRELEKVGKAIFKEHKGIDIFVNVDFYSASLYYAMGFPVDLFTPLFAISRVSGWTAHVLEERFGEAAPKPALYRPRAQYIGDYCGPDECVFVPMDDR